MNSIQPIWIIARLTLREAFRRRLLWVLVGLTAVIVALTWWAFGRIADASPISGPAQILGVSQVTVMLAFMFSFVLAMTAVFAGSPAIGPDIENGLLLAVALATGYVAVDPLIAPVYLAGESLVLLTLAIVLSTRVASVAGGAMAVVAFGLAWMAGVMGGVGEAFNSDVLRWAGIAARLILPSDTLWRGAADGLTPAEEVLRSAGIANADLYRFSPFSGTAPGPLWLAWCVVWVVGALAIGILLLRRREL